MDTSPRDRAKGNCQDAFGLDGVLFIVTIPT